MSSHGPQPVRSSGGVYDSEESPRRGWRGYNAVGVMGDKGDEQLQRVFTEKPEIWQATPEQRGNGEADKITSI